MSEPAAGSSSEPRRFVAKNRDGRIVLVHSPSKRSDASSEEVEVQALWDRIASFFSASSTRVSSPHDPPRWPHLDEQLQSSSHPNSNPSSDAGRSDERGPEQHRPEAARGRAGGGISATMGDPVLAAELELEKKKREKLEEDMRMLKEMMGRISYQLETTSQRSLSQFSDSAPQPAAGLPPAPPPPSGPPLAPHPPLRTPPPQPAQAAAGERRPRSPPLFNLRSIFGGCSGIWDAFLHGENVPATPRLPPKPPMPPPTPETVDPRSPLQGDVRSPVDLLVPASLLEALAAVQGPPRTRTSDPDRPEPSPAPPLASTAAATLIVGTSASPGHFISPGRPTPGPPVPPPHVRPPPPPPLRITTEEDDRPARRASHQRNPSDGVDGAFAFSPPPSSAPTPGLPSPPPAAVPQAPSPPPLRGPPERSPGAESPDSDVETPMPPRRSAVHSSGPASTPPAAARGTPPSAGAVSPLSGSPARARPRKNRFKEQSSALLDGTPPADRRHLAAASPSPSRRAVSPAPRPDLQQHRYMGEAESSAAQVHAALQRQQAAVAAQAAELQQLEQLYFVQRSQIAHLRLSGEILPSAPADAAAAAGSPPAGSPAALAGKGFAALVGRSSPQGVESPEARLPAGAVAIFPRHRRTHSGGSSGPGTPTQELERTSPVPHPAARAGTPVAGAGLEAAQDFLADEELNQDLAARLASRRLGLHPSKPPAPDREPPRPGHVPPQDAQLAAIIERRRHIADGDEPPPTATLDVRPVRVPPGPSPKLQPQAAARQPPPPPPARQPPAVAPQPAVPAGRSEAGRAMPLSSKARRESSDSEDGSGDERARRVSLAARLLAAAGTAAGTAVPVQPPSPSAPEPPRSPPRPAVRPLAAAAGEIGQRLAHGPVARGSSASPERRQEAAREPAGRPAKLPTPALSPGGYVRTGVTQEGVHRSMGVPPPGIPPTVMAQADSELAAKLARRRAHADSAPATPNKGFKPAAPTHASAGSSPNAAPPAASAMDPKLAEKLAARRKESEAGRPAPAPAPSVSSPPGVFDRSRKPSYIRTTR